MGIKLWVLVYPDGKKGCVPVMHRRYMWNTERSRKKYRDRHDICCSWELKLTTQNHSRRLLRPPFVEVITKYEVASQSHCGRKLFQKPYIIFAEEADIVDAIFQ